MKGILQKGKEFRKDLFKKDEGAAAKPRVFGGVIDRDSESIPLVVSKCVEYLDATGLEFEGIFRKSGSLVQMNEFKARFEKGEDVDFTAILDPHIVAGLLKMYVRELAEPLLTFELYDVFLATVAIKEVPARIPKLRQVLSFLPRANLMVVRFLVSFLTRVSAKSKSNMMTPSNLAIVFAPNLLRPPLSGEQEIAAMMEDTPFSNELLQIFISHFKELFEGVESEKASEPKLVTEGKSGKSFLGGPPPAESKKPKPLPPIPPPAPPDSGTTSYEYQSHASPPEYQKPLPTKPATQNQNQNFQPAAAPLTRKASHEYTKTLPSPAPRPLNSSGPAAISTSPVSPLPPTNTSVSNPSFNSNPFIVNNGAKVASPKISTNPFLDSPPPQHSPPQPPHHSAAHNAPLPSPPKKPENKANRHARNFNGGNPYTQLQ